MRNFRALANPAASAALVAGTGSTHVGGPPRLATDDPIDRLPPDARAKLQRLRDEDQDQTAAIRAITDRLNDARRRKAEEEQALRRLIDPWSAEMYGSETVPPDDPIAKAVERRIDDLGLQIKDLTERKSALEKRRWRGLAAIEHWLADLPRGIEIEPHPAIEAPKVNAGGVLAAIEAVRQQQQKLGADLHEVRSACLPASVVKAKIREQLDALAERGAINVLPALEAGLPLIFPTLTVRAELFGHSVGADGPQPVKGVAAHDAVDVPALVAWAFRDALAARLDADVDELADDRHALSDEDRKAHEASLLAALLDAERLEEVLIETAAGEGRAVPRRSNADPRAVLGLASSLPAPR